MEETIRQTKMAWQRGFEFGVALGILATIVGLIFAGIIIKLVF